MEAQETKTGVTHLATYKPNSTLARFHNDDFNFIRGVMGPIGSGKSLGMCMEIFYRSFKQEPDKNGVRKTRWAVVRQSYPELRSTTLKTWTDWFPDHICHITYTAPITGNLDYRLPDGTQVDCEIYFLALDNPKDAKKVLSLELTGAWINEAREISPTVLDAITGRVGRYPKKADAKITWSGIIMDTNPPDNDHWWYKMAEEVQPKGWKFYRQPPALLKINNQWVDNPRAENIENLDLGYEYYKRLIPGKKDEWIKVYVQGDYGIIMDGKPVYPEFNDIKHVSLDTLKPMRGLSLILGFDFGLTPACAIGQLTPKGKLMILDEKISENMGIRQFGMEVIKPMLANDYTGMNYVAWCDPAGKQRTQTDESTCVQELEKLGITVQPAPTNLFVPRREAVAYYLNRMVDGEPAFIISRKCNHIRKAFQGGYMYERVQVKGDDRFKDAPVKNTYSHISDALQYLCLGVNQTGSYNNGLYGKQPTRQVKVVSSRGWA